MNGQYTNKIQKLLKAYLKKHDAQSNNKKADRDSIRPQNGKDGKARKS